MTDPTLVILAAGLGTRFGGLKQLAPVGPHGDAILDYSAADARRAGFASVVVVVRSEIAAAVAAHLSGRWPADLPVVLRCQDTDAHAVAAAGAGRVKPLGTAHAVHVAGAVIDGPFAVINADDHYGAAPYRLLSAHLRHGRGDAMVAFEVAHTVLGDRPVTRALCTVDGHDHLSAIEEGTVAPGAPSVWVGQSGRCVTLAGDEPVSMNFWGFQPDTLGAFAEAVESFMATDAVAGAAEILLPDVVRSLVVDPLRPPVTVLRSAGRCIGVTHSDDLTLMQTALSAPAW